MMQAGETPTEQTFGTDETSGSLNQTDQTGGSAFDSFIQVMMQSAFPQAATKKDQGPDMITGEDPRWAADINPPSDVGYQYPRYGPDPMYGAQLGGEAERLRGRPQYTTDDPLLILNGMSSAELAALELQFVQAGYVDPKKLSGGSRGAMIQNFSSLVQEADFNRIDWMTQLKGDINDYTQWQKDNPEEKEKSWRELHPFIAPAYKAPDYATLAQSAKAQLRNELGRDVTSGEMKLLTGFMGDASRDQWQANEVSTQRAEWEALARGAETGEAQSSGTVQQVDAAARFQEMFDQRYEGELDHRQRVDASERKTGNLFGSIDTISRMTS